MLIELTPSGRTAADTILQAISDLEHRGLAELPPAAIAGFHTVVEALTGASR